MTGNNPFDDDDIDDMFNEMQRLFEELFSEAGTFDAQNGLRQQSAVTDIRQHDNKVVAVIDAAEFDKDDLDVRAADGKLHVMATNAHGKMLDQELPLPAGAEPDQAETRFNNGILEVDIPLTGSGGVLDL